MANSVYLHIPEALLLYIEWRSRTAISNTNKGRDFAAEAAAKSALSLFPHVEDLLRDIAACHEGLNALEAALRDIGEVGESSDTAN